MMSLAVNSTYLLVNGILDQGLPFVASHLEKRINRPIVITDKNGIIHYSGMKNVTAYIDEMIVILSVQQIEDEYYYHERLACLCYPVEYRDSLAYIFVNNLPKNRIAKTITILSDAKLALKCYFSNQIGNKKDSSKLEKELTDYLLSGSSVNIREIIDLYSDRLEIQCPFYVSALESDNVNEQVDWQGIHTYSKNYLKNSGVDALSLACPNFLVIITAHYKNDLFDINPNGSKLAKCKEAIEKRFGIFISQGVGKPYSIFDVKKSYNEARIALTLSRLMGREHFVQQYTDLGFFTHIFSQDMYTLDQYCHKTLGKLMDYDRSNKGELLPTLRLLLDNSFAWKITADRLFIHINTLHYRVNKIEELLCVDLSTLDNRLNIYTAIKVFDTLQITGFSDLSIGG